MKCCDELWPTTPGAVGVDRDVDGPPPLRVGAGVAERLEDRCRRRPDLPLVDEDVLVVEHAVDLEDRVRERLLDARGRRGGVRVALEVLQEARAGDRARPAVPRELAVAVHGHEPLEPLLGPRRRGACWTRTRPAPSPPARCRWGWPGGSRTRRRGRGSLSTPAVFIFIVPSITSWRSVWPGCTCGLRDEALRAADHVELEQLAAGLLASSCGTRSTPRGSARGSPLLCLAIVLSTSALVHGASRDYGASALVPDHSGRAVTLGRVAAPVAQLDRAADF